MDQMQKMVKTRQRALEKATQEYSRQRKNMQLERKKILSEIRSFRKDISAGKKGINQKLLRKNITNLRRNPIKTSLSKYLRKELDAKPFEIQFAREYYAKNR